MRKTTTGNTGRHKGNATFSFDSVHSFADFSSTERVKHGKLTDRCGSEIPTSDWNGNVDFHEAYDYATKGGWSEYADEIDGMRHEIQGDDFQSKNPTHIYDVAGGEVDMGRFMSGEPECMIELMPKATPTLLTIVTQISASSGVNGETLAQRGIAVLALAQQLRREGYSLDIWAVQSADYGKQYDCLVKVSDSRYPEGDDVTMFALAHPAMLRRLVFGWVEGCDDVTRSNTPLGNGHGYGGPREAPLPSTMAVVTESGCRTPLVLPSVAGHSGMGWLHFYSLFREQLNKLEAVNV